jgi:hypothetical protein
VIAPRILIFCDYSGRSHDENQPSENYIQYNNCVSWTCLCLPDPIYSFIYVRTGGPLCLDHASNQERSRPTTCHATLVIPTVTHSNFRTPFLFILLYLISCDTTLLRLCFHIIIRLIRHRGPPFSVYIAHVHSHIRSRIAEEHTSSESCERILYSDPRSKYDGKSPSSSCFQKSSYMFSFVLLTNASLTTSICSRFPAELIPHVTWV